MTWPMRIPLLVIVGPTASGKSAVGMALARRLDGEIVSADSMQVYRGMDIGTAKPTPSEQAEIRHHLIDVADPDEVFNVARYQELASAAIDDAAVRGKLPIMVGGTGLYVDAVVRGFLFPDEGRNSAVRARLEQEAAGEGGAPTLHARLASCDPEAARRIHPNDLRRIVRALEVFEVTGRPITELRRKHVPVNAYSARLFGLTMPREALTERIDARVDQMVAAGLVDEVRRLLQMGYDGQSTAMQAIGYKEFAAYLAGREGLEQAIDEVKLETRKYAKRQMTWFRKHDDITWIDVQVASDPSDVASEIMARLGDWLEEADTALGRTQGRH
ncbi:MAG TPA: tRNA (adenosine(37)-N6)-dimethylallyltransferase MiaA [Bacillota bacterium]|nr:tRNA (adenosine(37)-N6)-dimethylallyltransferase MiaA [Bacillota bacterium]